MTTGGGRWRSVLRYLVVTALVITGAVWALNRFVLAPPVAFPALGRVDSVSVWVTRNAEGQPARKVTDSAAVAALVAFADGTRSDWHGTWHTMPSPPVSACYFRGDELRYCIAAGREGMAAWGSNRKGLRSATPEETSRFAALAGVPETMLDRW